MNNIEFDIVKGKSIEDIASILKELVNYYVILATSNIIQEGKYLKMIVQLLPRIEEKPFGEVKPLPVEKKKVAKKAKTEKSAKKGVKNGRK